MCWSMVHNLVLSHRAACAVSHRLGPSVALIVCRHLILGGGVRPPPPSRSNLLPVLQRSNPVWLAMGLGLCTSRQLCGAPHPWSGPSTGPWRRRGRGAGMRRGGVGLTQGSCRVRNRLGTGVSNEKRYMEQLLAEYGCKLENRRDENAKVRSRYDPSPSHSPTFPCHGPVSGMC